MDNKKDEQSNKEFLKALSLFSQLGFSMAACIVTGFLVGRYLDRVFGSAPWLTLILALVGAGSAIKIMYDIAKNWK